MASTELSVTFVHYILDDRFYLAVKTHNWKLWNNLKYYLIHPAAFIRIYFYTYLKDSLSLTFEHHSADDWHHPGCMALADKSLIVLQRCLQGKRHLHHVIPASLYSETMTILKILITVFFNIALTSTETCRMGCSCIYPLCCCYLRHFPTCHCPQRSAAWALTLTIADQPEFPATGQLSLNFANWRPQGSNIPTALLPKTEALYIVSTEPHLQKQVDLMQYLV